MPKIGCAVIGAGSWGRLIAQSMSQSLSFELLGIIDSDPEKSTSLADDLKISNFVSIEALLNTPALQAVAVASPNDLHLQHALQVIRAGKHLLLEKPMALTFGDAQAIEREATKRKRILILDHIQRFFPLLIKVNQLIQSGHLGEIVAVSISRRDMLLRTKTWLQERKRVGGLLYQSAVHEFDLLRWFFGEIAEIYCVAGQKICLNQAIDYPDTVLTQLRFQSGLVGQVWNCMSDPLMGYEGVITGRLGTAWFDLYGGEVRWRRLGEAQQEFAWSPKDQWSAPAAYEKGTMPVGEVAALSEMVANFAASIQGIAGPVVTGVDGVRSVELAQAGYISIVEGRPISLPLTESDHSRKAYLEVEIPM